MLKANHVTLIILSGLVWLIVGCVLLPLGLNFLVAAILRETPIHARPMLSVLAPHVGLEQAVLVVLAICLAVGYLKGRYVLAKSVQRGVQHILKLPNPAPISKVYTKKYYILLGSMVLLGFIVRLAPLDVRGAVDVIVGAALINGAFIYFRQAFTVWQQSKQQNKGYL